MTSLLAWALRAAVGCLALAMVFAVLRLLRGPTPEDRILAFDCLNVDGMLLMLALGLSYRSSTYYEVALLVAVVGFVSSAAMAKFLLRGEVIE